MLWLVIGILAYFFLALASFYDKLFLKEKEDPKAYVFYVGLLGGLVIFLAPFFEFSLISIWPILEGIVYIIALYFLYYVLNRSEASTIIPAQGAIQVIFILLLSVVFFEIKEVNLLALGILILGSFLISFSKRLKRKEILFCVFSAFLFAIDFVLVKQVFLMHSFLEGLFLMRMTSFFVVLFFLLDKSFRKNIFKTKKQEKKFFFLAQIAGGLGILLQSYAIRLVSPSNLAVLNAIKGIQYVFLFLLAVLFLKEDFSRRNLFFKIVSIVLIVVGIILFAI
ncbi:MAG: EamA family transporter [Candidatus Paceibacterota bacterium]